MKNSPKHRVALNFDLFQNKLKEYGFKNPLEAYKELGKELKKNGFVKRQQSSWFSKENLNETQVALIVTKITKKIPWLSDCVKHFTATTEEAAHDILPMAKENKNLEDLIDFNQPEGQQNNARKAIHFDLSVSEIDKYYENRSIPYSKIRKVMDKYDFKHQQGSGYVTEHSYPLEKIQEVVDSLKMNVDNFEDIVKHLDLTFVEHQWDLVPMIKGEFDFTKNLANLNGTSLFQAPQTQVIQNFSVNTNVKVNDNVME